jgi:hypothetical protein
VLDARSVLFCGLTLSVDDFVRARAAKTGESKEYSVSQETRAIIVETRDPIAKSSVSRMAESQVSSVSQESKVSCVSRIAAHCGSQGGFTALVQPGYVIAAVA